MSRYTTSNYLNLNLKIKILTWNVGDLQENDNKLDCIAKNLFGDTDNTNNTNNTNNTYNTYNLDESTIYVLGLQEVNDAHIANINKYISYILNKQKPTHTFNTNTKFSRFGSFDLFTCLIFPLALKDKIDIKWNNKNLPSKPGMNVANFGKTKGYLDATVRIKKTNTPLFTLVNIHLPFHNENFTLKNIEKLFTHYRNKDNIIIFGDFNSRSKFDDTCINNSGCQPKFIKNAEGPVDKLEERLNSKTCTLSKKRTSTRRYTNTSKKFTSESVNSQNPLLTGGNPCDTLITELVSKDAINDLIKTEYKEDDIHFLPTYKVDPYKVLMKSGRYSLHKDGKNRLAGYADRIIYRGTQLDSSVGSYKKLDCEGNDHFPLMLELKYDPYAIVVGGRKRRHTVKKRRHTVKKRRHTAKK